MRKIFFSLLVLVFIYITGCQSQKTKDPVLGITNFNTGQVSPLVEGRSDFPKYNSSCRTLQNMLNYSQGPVIKRPGTEYIAEAKTANSVLIPFEYSTDDTYMIEAGNHYFRFYRNGGPILDANSKPVEVNTPFDTNELQNLRYAQSDNAMYNADGNDPPQKLLRTSLSKFTISDANIVTGPFQTENALDINMAPAGDVNKMGASITLVTNSKTMDANIFKAGHIGSLWMLNQDKSTSVLTGTLDGNGVSPSSSYFVGGYSFYTSKPYGQVPWLGTVTLERSTNNGLTWNAALAPLHNNDPTTDVEFSNPSEKENDGAIYRVKLSDYKLGTCTYSFTMTDIINHGIVKITGVTNGTHATAKVVYPLTDTTPTMQWREGYWSYYRGYPNTITFHQQRLIFGGNKGFPQTVWFGKADPDNYINFTEGTLDTDPFIIALPGQNPIRWLLSQDYLFIGTSGSCGKYGEQGKAITPTSPNYNEQTKSGSANIQAVIANNSILYPERGANIVRELAYSLQYDKYLSPDLTILAEDITRSGIKKIVFQKKPIQILWCVLNDGNCATFTFNREQEIMAWSVQHTDGKFVDVSILPANSAEDEVWFETERDVNSVKRYFIERMRPISWGNDDNDCFFVDSGLAYNGTPTNHFGGLYHLNNRTVSVYADGIVCPSVQVTNGEVTIANLASKVAIGLTYTSKLETMPIVFNTPAGISSPMNTKVNNVYIDFFKTGACKYGNGQNSQLTNINFFSNFISAKQPLYTSTDAPFYINWTYGSKKKQTIYIESSQPVPLCIRALYPAVEAMQ